MKCQIHDWFVNHDEDDSEFFILENYCPFSVVPPAANTGTVVYCTKQHCILQLLDGVGGEPPFAAVMRGGLPSERELDWLTSTVGSRRLVFLGDADPPDLLTFAWLRQRVEIEHLGLTDALLSQNGVPQKDLLATAMSEGERAALPLVSQYFGDLQLGLGPWCAGLLRSGRKIELEAMFSFGYAGLDPLVDTLTNLPNNTN